ncbi:MAG: YbaN family protein [Gammaproteobacteria bacterium]|nr:YbaN family protein [Gammaproteobacteria bacterium]
MSGSYRFVYRCITGAALSAAALGAVLPVLPTTPFLLVAAWSASRHSPELEARLLAHPRFGPHLVAWRRERAITRRAKVGALALLAVSLVVSLLLLDAWQMQIVVCCIVTAVGAWLANRPEPAVPARGER